MTTNKCLERSHVKSSLKPLVVTYLLLAAIVSSVIIGISLVGEPTAEIVNGLPFATDIPGLDVSAVANGAEWKAQPRSVQSIRFVRLIPVPDHSESGTESISEVYSSGREDQHGSALPVLYSPIFGEGDLMRQLTLACCEIIFVTMEDAPCGI